MVSWPDSRFVLGTLLLQGRSAKILGTEVLAKRRRHAAFKSQRGAKNYGKFVAFAVCLWNLLPPTWSAKFLGTEILAKHGRHAAFEAQRGEPKIVASSSDSCVRGAGGAKTLSTEKKGFKKKTREFPLVFRYKNHPVGWCDFVNLLLVPFSGVFLSGTDSQLSYQLLTSVCLKSSRTTSDTSANTQLSVRCFTLRFAPGGAFRRFCLKLWAED